MIVVDIGANLRERERNGECTAHTHMGQSVIKERRAWSAPEGNANYGPN